MLCSGITYIKNIMVCICDIEKEEKKTVICDISKDYYIYYSPLPLPNSIPLCVLLQSSAASLVL
jgi:hypothetical protein